MPEINLAVISDLHCRLSGDPRESFLTVGAPRRPSTRHPVQSAIELIQREGLKADSLLLPGDFANRASPEGLSAGWECSNELGRHLKVSSLVPVIGNHDIDSRHTRPDQTVFSAVRNLHVDFPYPDERETQRFFSDGYAVIRMPNAEIIAINTVIDQVDEHSAKRGTFDLARIDAMENSLRGTLVEPLRVALMHHHPILHSGSFLEDTDVLPTGDALVSSLRRLGCRLIIHGHKHFARLTYTDRLAVMASGSFSAQLFEYGTSMGNTFHMVHLEGSSIDDVRGRIRTWVFRLGQGWKEANAERDGFPFLAGFGRTTPMSTLVDALKQLSDSDQDRDRFSEDQVKLVAPEVVYLTPIEREEINRALGASNLSLSSYIKGKLELWREFVP